MLDTYATKKECIRNIPEVAAADEMYTDTSGVIPERTFYLSEKGIEAKAEADPDKTESIDDKEDGTSEGDA